MQIKKTLMIGGVLTTLMSSSALVVDAYAQKGAWLQPLTGWSVKSVSGAGPNAYCAIARQFDSNLILTVARNRKSETSLAFDFEHRNFDTASLSRIVLDAGAGQERSFNLKPSSSKAFVVKLGNDEPFFQALEKTGLLRAEIGSSLYNFNLSDIDDGSRDLSSCLASSVQPAAGEDSARSAAASAPAPVDKQPGLLPSLPAGEPVANLKEKIAFLQQENARLKAVQGQVAASQADAGHYERQLAELRRENENLKNAVSRNAQELVALEQQKANVVDEAALEEMRRKVADLEQQKSVLESKAENAQSKLAETQMKLAEAKNIAAHSLKDLQAEQEKMISSLHAENQVLLEKLASIETSAGGGDDDARQELAVMQERLEALKAQNAELTQRLDNAGQGAQDYEAQIQGYEARIASLTEALESKSAQKEVYEVQLQELQTQISAVEKEYEAFFETKQTANAALQGQLAQLKAENERLMQEVDAGETQYTVQLETLRSENETLQAQLAARQEDQQGLAELEEKLQGLVAEKTKLDGALQEIAAQAERMPELQKAKAQDEETIEKLESRLAHLEQENLALNQRMILAQDETMDRALDEAAYAEKVAALEDKNASLTEQLELFIDAQDAAEERMAALEVQNASLTQSLKQEQEKLAQIESIKGSLAALKQESEVIQGELIASDQNLADVQQKYAVLQSENETLKATLEERTAALGKTEAVASDIPALQEQLVQREEALDTVRQELAVLQAEKVALADKLALAEKEKAELADENSKLAHKSEFQEDELERLIAELDGERLVSEELIAAERELEGSYEELAVLEEENRILQEKLALAEEAVPALNDQLALLEKENADLNKKVSLSDDTLASTDQKFALLQDEKTALQEQLEAAKGQLADQQAELLKIAGLEKDLEDVRAELALAQVTAGEKDEVYAALQAENKRLSDEVAVSAEQLKLAQVNLDDVRVDIETLSKENGILQADKNTLETDHAAAQEQLSELEESVAVLKEEKTGIQDRLILAQDALAQKDAELARLSEGRDEVSAELADAEAALEAEKGKDAALSELEEKLAQSEKNNMELAALLQEEQERIKTQTARLEEYEAEVSGLQQAALAVDDGEADSLKEELALVQASNEELKARLGQAQLALAEAEIEVPVQMQAQDDATPEQPVQQAVASADTTSAVIDLTAHDDVATPDPALLADAGGTQDEPPAAVVAAAPIQPVAVQEEAWIAEAVVETVPPVPSHKPKEPAEDVVIAASRNEEADSLEIPELMDDEADETDSGDDVVAAQLNAIETAAGSDTEADVLVPVHKKEPAAVPAVTEEEPMAAELPERAVEKVAEPVQEILAESDEQGAEVFVPPAMEMQVSGDDGLNEAQRQEQALSRSIGHEGEASGDVQQARAPAPLPVEENVAVQAVPVKAAQTAVSERSDDSSVMAAAAGRRGFAPSVTIENVLRDAQIPVHGAVASVDEASGQDLKAYQWKSQDELYGSAHQKPMGSQDEFDGLVENYLTNTEERCPGDFAISPSSTQQVGDTRIDSYEIACVGDDVDSSASLVFFNHQGTFTIVAHEAPTAGMATAMDYRDRLLKSLNKS